MEEERKDELWAELESWVHQWDWELCELTKGHYVECTLTPEREFPEEVLGGTKVYHPELIFTCDAEIAPVVKQKVEELKEKFPCRVRVVVNWWEQADGN